MIRQIYSSGRYMSVIGGTGANYVSASPNSPRTGSMWFNTSLQQIEVYDGSSWIALTSNTPTISLTSEAESLLDWAKRKKTEEEQEQSLAQSNPTIADLLEQKKSIEEKINIVKTLIKPEDKV